MGGFKVNPMSVTYASPPAPTAPGSEDAYIQTDVCATREDRSLLAMARLP